MTSHVCGRLYLLVFLCLCAPALLAQSEDDIKAHVTGHTVYLRGLWASNSLVFDSVGKLQGDTKATSFTLCGLQIKKVQLKSDRLLLEGTRIGLFVKKGAVQQVPLFDRVRIDIGTPDTGDFNSRLDAILVPRIDDLLPRIPRQLQRAARQFFLQGSSTITAAPQPQDASSSVYKIGGAVTAPVLLQQVDPQFSEAARKQRFGGKVVLQCHVEENGMTSHVEVIEPAGLGLDEQAVIAVSQYRFTPAKVKNQPVVVELKVVVNFELMP